MASMHQLFRDKTCNGGIWIISSAGFSLWWDNSIDEASIGSWSPDVEVPSPRFALSLEGVEWRLTCCLEG